MANEIEPRRYASRIKKAWNRKIDVWLSIDGVPCAIKIIRVDDVLRVEFLIAHAQYAYKFA